MLRLLHGGQAQRSRYVPPVPRTLVAGRVSSLRFRMFSDFCGFKCGAPRPLTFVKVAVANILVWGPITRVVLSYGFPRPRTQPQEICCSCGRFSRSLSRHLAAFGEYFASLRGQAPRKSIARWRQATTHLRHEQLLIVRRSLPECVATEACPPSRLAPPGNTRDTKTERRRVFTDAFRCRACSRKSRPKYRFTTTYSTCVELSCWARTALSPMCASLVSSHS